MNSIRAASEIPSSKTSTWPLSRFLLANAILAAAVGALGSIYMGCATFSYLLLITGLLFRSERALHARLMASAIGLDLSIVLALEITRHAVETASKFELSALQQGHILASTLATALYPAVLYLGFMRLRGKPSPRQRLWHIRLGLAAFIFRTLGFFLMFALLAKSAETG